MNDRLWELLANYYTNRLTPEEKAELERLLLEHPDNWLKSGLMQQIRWELNPMFSSERANKITDRILKGEKENRAKYEGSAFKASRKWIAAVAIVLLISGIGLGIFMFHNSLKKTTGWQQVTTTNGMRSSLRLADGSEVWLNAGSTLRYPEDFNKQKREVYLTGEAYFIIKHDASRPFIVHTADMNIRVLGTEFNVQAYPDEEYSETSLIKGAVEVIVKQDGHNQPIYLKPDQKVIVKNSSDQIPDVKSREQDHPIKPLSKVSMNVILKPLKTISGHIIPETAWRENMLVFEDETLQSLAQRLDRWYGVHITIKDPALAKQRFTGRADNVSLEKLLQILQMIKPFEYSIHGKQVVIK
jgi:ferric-dicitrate binding protein FerR (iron transport regulator)